MKSAVVGFHDNTEEVGAGQFGQYPLYIICDRHIHGAQSAANVFLSRIETITDDYGVHGQHAFANYKGRLWFASKMGLHALRGNLVEDIYYPLKRYGGDETFMKTLLAGDMYVGANEDTQEVIFTDGKGTSGNLLVLNLEFNKWYAGSVDLDSEDTGPMIKVGEEIHFIRADGGQTGTTFEQETLMAKWRDGTNDAVIDLETNKITLKNYSQLQESRPGHDPPLTLLARFRVHLELDQGEDVATGARAATRLPKADRTVGA